MRLLERDMKQFYYASYAQRQMIYEDGIPTGEYTTGYGEPTQAFGTVSVATGKASDQEFGSFIDYDYIIHIEDEVCPFDENAAIWLPGTLTSEDPDGKVVRISEPRTYTAIAVKKVR